MLATLNSPALTSVGQAGYYDHQNLSVALAANLAPGTYYIGGIADDGNQVSEANEANNTYNVTQITVTSSAAFSLAAGQDHSDTFVFKPGFKNVTITDFDLASDIIEIERTVFANAEALVASAFEDGNGSVVIAATSNDTITIDNVGLAELHQHQADFHFV
ncbi:MULTISPECIES: hypothetical protein [unclassified Bradyrhizobium]|jgi:hypothetical protein|uniref:hypothetical protein n=1 Tax=unclassified Bradyrhizobium TaxID=2631580 RepID=UPI000489D164|nr:MULTISPECIES: hypothetical protein [unclassified Bradyrhizobium]